MPKGSGLSTDAVMGPNPRLSGQPYSALPSRIKEVTDGKLKAVFRPTKNNPNHVQIESTVELTGREFRDLLRKLFDEGVWQ